MDTQTIKGRYDKPVEIKIDETPLDWKDINQSAACNVLEYVRWLAEMDPDSTLTVGQLWHMYQQGRDDGIYPSEIVYDLGLSEYPDW